MKLKKAASVACILVTAHIVMNACLCVFSIIQMLPMIRQGMNWSFLLTPFYYVVALILDIAILLVFGSLALTKEQLIKDTTPDL